MENWAPSIARAKDSGIFPSFVHPVDLMIEQVSTKDIGHAAFRALNDPINGQRYISVAGPKQYSAADAALYLAEHLGQNVNATELDEDKWHGVWGGLGWSEDRCRLYQEFFNSINSGLARFSEEDDVWRGSDDLESVLKRMV